MLSSVLQTAGRRAGQQGIVAMRGVRHASNLPLPPKIATPKSVSGPAGGDSSRMESVVAFYKSLPKGNAAKRGSGIKGRFFDGDNASYKPIVWTIGTIFVIGYSLEYQHLKHHKNYEH